MPPKAKSKSKTKMSKKPIPEDFELSSDEETKVVKIDEEKRMKSKDIYVLIVPTVVVNCYYKTL